MADREKLSELLFHSPSLVTLYGEYEDFAENADFLIVNGVTVRERGRWIVPKIPHITVVGICSECGKMSDRNYNFCPNCGADMRGEEDG